MIYKIKWILSALFLSFFFKKIKFPSYVSMPIFCCGVRRIEIGRKVRIFPGMRIETHQRGTIEIEDDVAIGQNFHVTSGGKLVIGKGTTISANVFITNIDHEYRNIEKPIHQQELLISDTIIGENCFIGIGASIQAGTKLGKHCVVGTNSVVRGEFPDYSVIAGVPAKIIKTYDHESGLWVKVINKE